MHSLSPPNVHYIVKEPFSMIIYKKGFHVYVTYDQAFQTYVMFFLSQRRNKKAVIFWEGTVMFILIAVSYVTKIICSCAVLLQGGKLFSGSPMSPSIVKHTNVVFIWDLRRWTWEGRKKGDRSHCVFEKPQIKAELNKISFHLQMKLLFILREIKRKYMWLKNKQPPN